MTCLSKSIGLLTLKTDRKLFQLPINVDFFDVILSKTCGRINIEFLSAYKFRSILVDLYIKENSNDCQNQPPEEMAEARNFKFCTCFGLDAGI